MNVLDQLILWCHAHPNLTVVLLAPQAWFAFWGFFGALGTQAELTKHKEDTR
jgi:hypothetical protein